MAYARKQKDTQEESTAGADEDTKTNEIPIAKFKSNKLRLLLTKLR